MAISDAKALMDMVKNAAIIAKEITKGYYEASVEMKAFPDKVKRLGEIATEWEERLRKFPLPADSPVRPRLDNAVALLHEEVERMEQNNRSCCLMFCKKVAFPELLTLNMNMVIQAFDDIPKSLQDKRECDQLVEDEANRVLAPFSFSSDEKYVPINETVEELRRALEDDTSRHNVVVLHGESGQGKTTMAKYLVLEYQQKSTQKIQFSSSPISTSSGYFNKIYFISCGKNADSTILMQKLWKELGYRTVDESRAILDRFEQGEAAQLVHQRRKPEIEDTRRKIMARLENRERMLIVLEDVSEQNVIEDLHIKLTCIKYLITTQNSHIWLDAERVRMAKPTAEEAARVLANHVVGWDYGESFPQEVQEEVGGLVEDVDRKPFILANVATSIRSKKEAMDPKTWRTLRRGLVETLKEVDETKRRPTAFGESCKPDVVAAMTMAVDSFTERTQTLLFFVVLFTEDERDVETPSFVQSILRQLEELSKQFLSLER